MPAATASTGWRIFTSLPWTWTSPDSSGSAPKMARMTSVRPAPIRPANPRISPLRTEKLTSRTSLPRWRFLTAISTSWPEVSGMRFSLDSRRRPTIIAITSAIGVSAGTVPTVQPSRITVMRSEMRWISSILCEM